MFTEPECMQLEMGKAEYFYYTMKFDVFIFLTRMKRK